MTKRQVEVLERLELGMAAQRIATDMGISRNAVYQIIERLRRQGALPESYTPSGQPPRRQLAGPGVVPVVVTTAPRRSSLAELRELAAGDAEPEGPAYVELIEGAIAAGDAVGLAYELGRLDGREESGLTAGLVESALRRLSVLPSDPDADK